MPESTTAFVTEMAAAIGQEMGAAIRSLREDQDNRHNVANISQTALDMATTNRAKIEGLENRMTALLGDGTGSNGRIAELANMQRQTQSDMADVKTSMKQMADSIGKIEKVTEESKSWMSGGRGLFAVLGGVATLISILGAISGLILYLSHH